MTNIARATSSMGLVTLAGLAWALTWALTAHAEDSYDNGRVAGRTQSAPFWGFPPSTIFAYGENPTVEFPPRNVVRRHSARTTGLNSYCVRTCDGRYFPASSDDRQSVAERCKALCPASETKVFSGFSIEKSSSRDGKLYSAIPNAFRYRKEMVSGCTCNGKDVGLANIKIEEDKTLRRGDIVVTENGLEVVRRIDDGQPSFSAASKTVTTRYNFRL